MRFGMDKEKDAEVMDRKNGEAVTQRWGMELVTRASLLR